MPPPPAAAAPERVGIVFFKYNDLRLLDHEPLVSAHARCTRVLHVFVWDPLWHGLTRQARLPRCGPYRAAFLLSAVADLRARLLAKGGVDLVLRVGDSASVLGGLARAVGAVEVHAHAEVCTEELALEARLRRALPSDCALHTAWGGQTLVHRDDLSLPGGALPPVFSTYRRHVESRCGAPRPPLGLPRAWRPSPPSSGLPASSEAPPPLSPGAPPALGANAGAGRLPSLAELGADSLARHWAALGLPAGAAPAPAPDARAVMAFLGGESAGQARLSGWLSARGDPAASYKATRNEMLGADASSKLSPWLAAGCLSPRSVHAELLAYEARVGGRNEGSGWLLFELAWRDYFRFASGAWGGSLWQVWGPRGAAGAQRGEGGTAAFRAQGGAQGGRGGAGAGGAPPRKWGISRPMYAAWATGATGYPLVDAAQRELMLTGWQVRGGREVGRGRDGCAWVWRATPPARPPAPMASTRPTPHATPPRATARARTRRAGCRATRSWTGGSARSGSSRSCWTQTRAATMVR